MIISYLQCVFREPDWQIFIDLNLSLIRTFEIRLWKLIGFAEYMNTSRCYYWKSMQKGHCKIYFKRNVCTLIGRIINIFHLLFHRECIFEILFSYKMLTKSMKTLWMQNKETLIQHKETKLGNVIWPPLSLSQTVIDKYTGHNNQRTTELIDSIKIFIWNASHEQTTWW